MNAKTILKKLAHGATLAYGIANGCFLALSLLSGERWVIIAFYNTFAHILWLPAFPFFFAYLLARKFHFAPVFLPACLAFISVYGGQFSPERAQAQAGGETLSILTYNLLAKAQLFEPKIQIIRAANADIVLLQELTSEAAKRFSTELGGMYPYIAFHPHPERPTAGQGIMSRFPILASDFWQYNWLPHPRFQQRAMIQIQDQTLTIYNVHPSHPLMTEKLFDPSIRNREIEDILSRLENEKPPLILAGDFNMPDLSDDYRKISARFIDSYREAGWGLGLTFPYSPGDHPATQYLRLTPLLRLDYVFHSEEWRAITARVWPDSGGSDHLPVYVELRRAE